MSILGQATAGDPSVDNSDVQPAPISGGIVSAAAPTAPVQTTPTPSQQPTQPAPTDSGSRLSRIISAVANVASTALAGIPDKGRPSFVTGLGEGARAEQASVANQQAIKFKTFDDQVRAAQLHNQDLELQARTQAQADAHQAAQDTQHDWDEAHGLQYQTIPNSGQAATDYQGNNAPVQVGASKDSPCTIILNNTSESVTLIVQSVGNGGVSPLASSPTTAIKLPKSAGGGAGTTTVTQLVTQPAPSSGPVINTPNSCLFWGAGITPSQLSQIGSVINGTPITSAANLVYVYQFVLPVAMTVRQMVWYLNSGNVGEVFSFGIYNAAKNLVFQVTNTRATGVNIYASTFTGGTLQPGVYWYAQTCSGTTVNGINATSNSFGGSTFAPFALRNSGYSGAVQMSGVSANAATSGVLPASLGTISNATANIGASPALPMWAA